jgi:hypothetical protein
MMCRPAAGYYINVYNPPETKQNETETKKLEHTGE